MMIVALMSCGQPEPDKEAENAEFTRATRESAVLDFVQQKGIETKGRPLNVYFFSDNTCMSCNKDKLQNSIALFQNTKKPTVVIFDRDSMLKQEITNDLVTVIVENPEKLSKKGLRFVSPCVFIYDNGRFVKNLDMDMSFFEDIENMKAINGL